MTSIKLKFVVMFGVHYFIRIPSGLSYIAMKLWEELFLTKKLEKVEMIDGEIHQERSLEDSRKARHES